jgi:hypothetical protein
VPGIAGGREARVVHDGWPLRTAVPGAPRSTLAGPTLDVVPVENSARWSFASVAATQIRFGAVSAHGYVGFTSTSRPSLPAAVTKSVPGARAIASAIAWEYWVEPKLAFTILAPADAA